MKGMFNLAIILAVVIIRLAIKLRLIIPLLYMLIVWIFFRDWANAHDVLSSGILFALIFLSALSWAIKLIKNIRNGLAIHE